MKPSRTRFLSNQLYLIWGIVVVGFVAFFTGSFISSVVGYTIAMGIVTVGHRLIK